MCTLFNVKLEIIIVKKKKENIKEYSKKIYTNKGSTIEQSQ